MLPQQFKGSFQGAAKQHRLSLLLEHEVFYWIGALAKRGSSPCVQCMFRVHDSTRVDSGSGDAATRWVVLLERVYSSELLLVNYYFLLEERIRASGGDVMLRQCEGIIKVRRRVLKQTTVKCREIEVMITKN